MKNLKVLLLIGLLTLPTAAGAASVRTLPTSVQQKAVLPVALTDAEMDEAQGQWFFLAAPAAPAISAGAVAAGAAAVAAGAAIGNWLGNAYDAARKSGKESASDIPSWAKGQTGDGDTPRERAKDILDQRYGEGNYPTGPNSEYNKIKKNQERK